MPSITNTTVEQILYTAIYNTEVVIRKVDGEILYKGTHKRFPEDRDCPEAVLKRTVYSVSALDNKLIIEVWPE